MTELRDFRRDAACCGFESESYNSSGSFGPSCESAHDVSLVAGTDANRGDTLMDVNPKSEEINQRRRGFLGTAAVTVAAAQFLLSGSAAAQPSKAKLAGMRAVKPGTNTSSA